jgi:hypothetical protein
MLRATRVLFAAAPAVVKKTTGLVGLDVVPNARAVLTRLYEKTLTDIKVSNSFFSNVPRTPMTSSTRQ